MTMIPSVLRSAPVLILIVTLSAIATPAQRGGGAGPDDEVRGLRLNAPGALEGYTLFAPLTSDTTFLINMEGQVVRTWKSAYVPSGWVYMRENGNLLRGGNESETAQFNGGGQGGRLQEFTFDGDLVWDFSFNNSDHLTHHDVTLLPNGNILAIAWELKTPEEARRAGRSEAMIPERGLWPDMLVELEPQRPDDARVVWEWHSWDHLIQNTDPSLDNYGDPRAHPERIDINADDASVGPEIPADPPTDLFHMNAVAYNPELDQIVMSAPNFDEIWVIDHSTTSEEASGSAGGRLEKGGDLVYRWGNPQKYGRGTPEDQRLGFEHDVRWIPPGRPGAGNMTVFSNRTPGPEGTYTKVYEFTPPIGADGRYAIRPGAAFGPSEEVWSYAAESLQATYISGAERLENGNTLISSGPQGRLFEVTPEGEIVWEYWSLFSGETNTAGGGGAANPFSLFRAIRIPANHPAVAGRTLEPLNPQPPLISPESGVD